MQRVFPAHAEMMIRRSSECFIAEDNGPWQSETFAVPSRTAAISWAGGNSGHSPSGAFPDIQSLHFSIDMTAGLVCERKRVCRRQEGDMKRRSRTERRGAGRSDVLDLMDRMESDLKLLEGGRVAVEVAVRYERRSGADCDRGSGAHGWLAGRPAVGGLARGHGGGS